MSESVTSNLENIARQILATANEAGGDRVLVHRKYMGQLREALRAPQVETTCEPDAWMAEDGRVCTADLKRSQKPIMTAGFTIPLYRRAVKAACSTFIPMSPYDTEKCANCGATELAHLKTSRDETEGPLT